MTDIWREITDPTRHRDFMGARVQGGVPTSFPFAASIPCQTLIANEACGLVTTDKPVGVLALDGETAFEATLPTAVKEAV